MSICTYGGLSRKGNQLWGKWVCTSSVEDDIVQFCRKAFNKRYRNMWIDPLYFDDKYFRWTGKFFREVGVDLYPKITKLPKRRKGQDTLDWRALVWETAHNDISTNISSGVNPIRVIVKGVRIPDSNVKDGYREKITDVCTVGEFKVFYG